MLAALNLTIWFSSSANLKRAASRSSLAACKVGAGPIGAANVIAFVDQDGLEFFRLPQVPAGGKQDLGAQPSDGERHGDAGRFVDAGFDEGAGADEFPREEIGVGEAGGERERDG